MSKVPAVKFSLAQSGAVLAASNKKSSKTPAKQVVVKQVKQRRK
jgi:hypothetical protein